MNRPLRTQEPTRAQGKILDAAERIFAADGFSGAGMKAIAIEAGVAQGSLHYHFDTKDGLYAAVIERRARAINEERLALLAVIDRSAPNAVQQILEALLRPPLGPAGGGRDYARIFSNLLVGGPREVALVARLYDPTARQFIQALQDACPGASPAVISWGYHMAISALAGTLARSDRPDRLIGNDAPTYDTEVIIARLVGFAAGGLFASIAAELNDTP
ncbi:MAG: TetR/AcrR family transcriptional regulator [Arenibacterium sp.]